MTSGDPASTPLLRALAVRIR